MRNKIFRSIFISMIAVLIVTFAVFFIYSYDVISRIAGEEYNAWELFSSAVTPTLILFAVICVLAFFIAARTSRVIVKPINEIDPEHPEENFVYEELRPIVSKLSAQNYKVSKQLAMLRRRENEFNSITANMSEGLIVINARAEILSCNKSAREVFGMKDEVPRSILQVNASATFRAAISSALSGQNGYDFLRLGDKYYSLFATPVLHEKNVDGVVVVIIDVTEKEEREALRREFTSNISHELKTPLTSISGFAEIIKDGIADGEEARHFAENIHKEASRLITLVGDIIRLSQLDGGEIPYDEEKIDLLAVCDDVTSRLSGIASRAGITLTASGEHIEINGNSTAIEEMIYNLCDNGIKYNREGGYVRVNVFLDGDLPCVSVSDNGIGIPQDKQDRVFERFYRVDKSHSREIGGTGLGLSIVKHAAAYHKATISLESEEGVGTTITIKFPK